MTNAEKYSPTFGFEAGVAVEVSVGNEMPPAKYVGYFQYLHEKDQELYLSDIENASEDTVFPVAVDFVTSIRILSGPWGAWQFAPETADWEILWEDGDINFVSQSYFEAMELALLDEYGDEMDTECPKYTRLPRPWWATEAQP